MSFSWHSEVFFDELDLNGNLHNARYAVHVERAQSALFEQLGKSWRSFADRDADLHYAVRELHVEFLAAMTAPGPMRVELVGQRIGTTSAVYGFTCADPKAGTVFARGYRAIVKVDRDTGRPAPWSDWYREVFASLSEGGERV
ncbi:hotdog domain-containing protein [Kutzneria viridogrisea]|uniref:Acyl-CoA thioester hydrolase n=1 Tax=Kutzneria viridogrisea TaxID=47990 RepID=A0ABR6BMN8_9PSEU|nr:acyl-CoA thioester hydrolase [Kutzneria viridogrisea]